MSRFTARALAGVLAAGVLATSMASAAYADPPRHGRPGPAPQAWRQGQRFDARRAPNYQVVDYRRYHRLRPPPRGYRWVRSGNDAVLVGITSGIVASVIANGMLN